MADRTPQQVLSDMASGYLNPQAYDVEELKEFLDEAHNADARTAFQSALAETLSGSGIGRSDWEELTDDEFEDEAEWRDYLTALQAFLFEDGPYPIPDEDDED
ncbi:hypothetical protein Q5Y75_04965 [Ruegeria sp. 2205SS24-7]|uniref:hypothetical protein n=1 Tax=Ruegeria discodermiae TaxID=3064389 RepID=UPI00274285FA|nr:hypothetical protein [Ruegeria sp. 2205SS24-7]MDP5216559.1 hypothetical protein [Ruegeria sp. 2205SS24-7]